MNNSNTGSQFSVPEGMVDLSIGQPAFSLLPFNELKQVSEKFFAGEQLSFLQYGNPRGHYRFRLALSDFLTGNYGFKTGPEQLCIAAGASQALDMLCTKFASAGDTVLTEDPTYYLALDIFRDHRLKVEGIPLGDEGIDLESLERVLKLRVPAFLYIIPTYQNPTGRTYSTEIRKDLIRLCTRYGCRIIADEVYHLLYFNEKPPLSFSSFGENELIFSIGSFSKIFTPGVRLGWIAGQPKAIEDFDKSGLLFSGGGMNHFAQGIMNCALEQGIVERRLSFLREQYAERCSALAEGLSEAADSGLKFDIPSGGFFIWAELQKADADEILEAGRAEGISFHSGKRFSPSDSFGNCIRLSFCYYASDRLKEAAVRLCSLLQG